MRINVNTYVVNKLILILVLMGTLFVLASCSSAGLSQPPVSTPNTPDKPTENPAVSPDRKLGEVQIGAYIKGATWDKTLLYQLEDSLGHEFNIIQWFTSWPAPYEPYIVNRVLELGRKPLITWQSNGQTLDQIVSGKFDTYIHGWAKGVQKANGDVYIRIFPEMNGDWTMWNGEPEKLVRAWKHIVDIFRQENASNAKWVWSPNITDEPATQNNRMELYYPGDDYVDILGLDGFNWGTVRPWTAWKSFEDTFSTPYNRITALGDQPLWLAEVASTEKGGNKAAWITEMLNSTAFPKIESLIWFNEVKETDWRIESSHASEAAFKAWFTQRSLERTLASSEQ